MQFASRHYSGNGQLVPVRQRSARRARACVTGVAIAGAFAASRQTARAADVFWSASPATSNWNTTDLNFHGAAWNNASFDGAVFNVGSSSMLLTVTQPVSASSIDFQTGGYNIGGSSAITFGTGSSSLSGYGTYSGTSTASGGYSGIVDVTGTSTAVFNTAEIDAPITSTTGFKKEGKGLLVLGGSLNFTGSYPLTGTLTYTTGAYVLPAGNALLTANLAVGGTTPPSAGINAGTAGGILQLSSTASLPSTTTVSVGDGLFNIGSGSHAIAGLTFVNSASTYNTWNLGQSDPLVGGYGNGVIGSGTLSVNGDINVLYAGSPAKNTIQCNLNVGSGTQVIRLASYYYPGSTPGLLLSGNLSGSGALTVVPGYTTTGGMVNTTSQYGAMALFGNNTNTGPMTFDTGNVSITGTNTASAMTVYNTATVQLLGTNGSLGSAGTITVANNATLAVLNDAAYTAVGTGSGGTVSGSAVAGVNNNRISDSANVVLRGGTFTYNGASGQTCSETYGSLNASAGANFLNINIANVNTLGGSAALTAGSLTVGSTATLTVSSFYQVGNSAQHFFSSVTDAATGTNYFSSGAIIPRVITYTSNTGNYDLAYYDPVNGLSSYNGYSAANSLTGDSVVTTAVSGVGTTTINSLRVNGGSFALSLNGNSSTTLNIASGMILVNTGYITFQGSTASPKSQVGTINFGSAAGVITGNSSYYVTSFLPMTGTGGLILSGPSLYSYGSLSGLSGGITINSGTAYLYEGQGSNGTVSTYATPGPINIRNGTAAILYTSYKPDGTVNTLNPPNTYTEPTGLGDVNLGEPENNSSLLNDFGGNPVPTAVLNTAGALGGTTEYNGSVFTRNINFNNGGGSNAGAALQPTAAASFPEVLVTYSGITETLSGSIHVFSPGQLNGGTTPTAYNSTGPAFTGTISGPGILALSFGTFNFTGTMQTTGPIWIGPTSGATANFLGNANSTSTSPIIGWATTGRTGILAYSGQNNLPNGSITISNLSTTGASNGINTFIIRPLNTSTISNTININSDLTFNAPSGVVGTWAGQLTGSSALYVAGGNLYIPSPSSFTNTFNGPLSINGSAAVLTLTPGALNPSVINVVNSGTLAMHGVTTQAINVSGGILYPGYNISGSTTSLSLPSTTIFGATGTIELNLIGKTSTSADQLSFTGSSGPALGGNLFLNASAGVTFTSADAGDVFTLFNYGSGLPTGNFAVPLNLPSLPGGYIWNTGTLYTNGQISIRATAATPEAWNNASSGTWETSGNWTPSLTSPTFPGGNGSVESFGAVAGTSSPLAITVTLSQGETSGQLVFNGTNTTYTLTGGSLSMYNTATTASAINISAGVQTINDNVGFGSTGLAVNIVSGSLVLGGSVTGSGPLNITGPVTFNGALTNSGSLTVASGSSATFNGSGTTTVASGIYGNSTTLNIYNGTLNSGFTSGIGSVVNVSNGAVFTVNSAAQTTFNLAGTTVNVSGTMTVGGNTSAGAVNSVTSLNLNTASSLIVNAGGTFNFYSGLTLKTGASLVDNGTITGGTIGTGGTGEQTISLNATSSLSVGPAGSLYANLTMSNASTATFAGQTTGTGIKLEFMKTLSMANNSGGSASAPGNLTFGISSNSSNRTFVMIGNGSTTLNGHIDLGNGDMADVASSQLSTLWKELQIGYNGGLWNGSSSTVGSIASAAAFSDSTHLHALGLILDDTTGNSGTASGATIYSNFDYALSSPYNNTINNTISATTELIKYTYYGDANLDGQVDGSDYSLIDNRFTGKLTGWYNGDFNYDGVVNGSDYTLMDNAFNTQGVQISTQVATATAQVAGTSAVPEPNSVDLVAMAAAGLLGRRWRSSRRTVHQR